MKGSIGHHQRDEIAARIGHPSEPYAESGGLNDCPLLLSIPHSGRYYPAELLQCARPPIEQLRFLEDPLVDLLVADAAAQGIPFVSGNYARAWIDLNRRETELDARQISPSPPAHIDHRSPRVAAGLGLIPRTIGNGRQIYDKLLPLETVSQRIREVHRPYHERITTRLAAMKARHGVALLCDMHSMPSLPAPQAADIVIGDRHGQTAAPWLTDLIAEWLTQQGYRVTHNLPYAGGHGVERHGRTANAVHALQLEFDRRLYLKSDRLTLNENAGAIKALIAGLGMMLREVLDTASGHRLAAE